MTNPEARTGTKSSKGPRDKRPNHGQRTTDKGQTCPSFPRSSFLDFFPPVAPVTPSSFPFPASPRHPLAASSFSFPPHPLSLSFARPASPPARHLFLSRVARHPLAASVLFFPRVPASPLAASVCFPVWPYNGQHVSKVRPQCPMWMKVSPDEDTPCPRPHDCSSPVPRRHHRQFPGRFDPRLRPRGRIGEELYDLVDNKNRKKLILDFTKVQFLSSSALGVLITLRKKSAPSRARWGFCALRKELVKVFEITRLTSCSRSPPTRNRPSPTSASPRRLTAARRPIPLRPKSNLSSAANHRDRTKAAAHRAALISRRISRISLAGSGSRA